MSPKAILACLSSPSLSLSFSQRGDRSSPMHQRTPLAEKKEEMGDSSSCAHEGRSKSLVPSTRLFLILSLLSCSLLFLLFFHTSFSLPCARSCTPSSSSPLLPTLPSKAEDPNGLELMKGHKVLLVSHELSLTGGPLLLMELAVLLRNAGTNVKWVTNQRETGNNSVAKALELRLIEKGVHILLARSAETIKFLLEADLVVLNTAVAGKWLEVVSKDVGDKVFPKVLWWIHEMRGHYFKLDLVKHLPYVGGAMIDSHATANYWKNRTKERLGITMPTTYVVHLGNSKELSEASENGLARRLLREHVRDVLGVRPDIILFAIINSVSRGKGQDLFLKSFYEALQIVKDRTETHPDMHAVVVGSDMSSSFKYEMELRSYVKEKNMESSVHFVNKTMNVIPYLAAVDVLVQNAQARGECFGRITIEAMAFHLPVLGTAAGGTMEIVVNGTTGLLHPVGKDGVLVLAKNMVELYYNQKMRLDMGKKGFFRVQKHFMERHMTQRISHVFHQVLSRSKAEA